MTEKPKVKLIGTDGNVFALLGKCTQALEGAGMPDKAKSLQEEVFNAKSYDEALRLFMKYCYVY